MIGENGGRKSGGEPPSGRGNALMPPFVLPLPGHASDSSLLVDFGIFLYAFTMAVKSTLHKVDHLVTCTC